MGIRQGYPNLLGMRTVFIFSSPVDVSRVISKYIETGDET